MRHGLLRPGNPDLAGECLTDGDPDPRRRARWFGTLLQAEPADFGADAGLAGGPSDLILEHAQPGEQASLEQTGPQGTIRFWDFGRSEQGRHATRRNLPDGRHRLVGKAPQIEQVEGTRLAQVRGNVVH